MAEATSWTLAELNGHTCVLTMNNRLAQELRERYDARQAAAGRAVWPSADILPWQAWLRRQYEYLLDTGATGLVLINPVQERLLWQEIIESAQRPNPLLRPEAAAKAAQAAFALSCSWQLERHPLHELGGDDTRTFLAWQRVFIRTLTERRLLSTAQLEALVTTALDEATLPVPGRLVHSGFDALSPTQSALLNGLRARGCPVDEHCPGGHKGDCRRVAATDVQTEIRSAAEWARRELAAQPQARIGIVVPRIAQRLGDLQRVLTEVLAPAACLPGGRAQAVFNVSLGTPFADRPLVVHALAGLGLLGGEQPLALIGQLLRSPFVSGHATEWEARALLDVALREDGMPLLDLPRLQARLARFAADDPRHCPDLAGRLASLSRLRRTLPRQDRPAQWARHFQASLKALGWPGDGALDSSEFQQRERLQRLFSEFAELGRVRAHMRLGEALEQLQSLAADTLFQPESPPARVQVLGPLEAAGLDFDRLWLLGLDDRCWPPAPGPNPLLPYALQRELGMPHASAERELAFAATLTDRLRRAAPVVIASHACSEAEHEQRPSPLIRDWPLIEAPLPADTLRAACSQAGLCDVLPPAAATPATASPRGGAGLLAAQASCPFQAVARYRLDTRPLAEPSFSPDPTMIGVLVHELLQRVWQQLRDSQTLARADGARLRTRIAPLADAILADVGRGRPDLFTPAFCALEAVRLTELAIAWLEVERERGQAFAVEALEKDRIVELQGLQLTTRADRVDRLADGRLAIIDYKTGSRVTTDGWFDPRLSEPQLPLYCVQGDHAPSADAHAPGEVGAVVLARVRSDTPGCGFVGLSRAAGFAPGVKTPEDQDAASDWAQTLARWRRALDGLAAEFAQGRADPTPSRQACQYCAYGALCRVEELLTGDDDG